MKKLYLVRHAKSTRQYSELPDFERPLSYRGRTDAPQVAEALRGMKVSPDLIMSSPATRALATARLMAEHLDYPLNKILVKEDIYEAWLDGLVNVLKAINPNHISVMLIGHNPGLHLLARYISEFPYDNVPTCAVVAIDLLLDDWKDLHDNCGKVMFFEKPRKEGDIS